MDSLHPFRCALKGIEDAIATQRHLRIHIVVAGFVALFGLLLGLPYVDLVLLLMAIALVVITELLNTAVELTVDLVSPAIHPIARRVKDIAAGAVLIAALVAAVVGIIILAPPLFRTLVASPLSAKSAMLAAVVIGLVGSIVAALSPRPSKSKPDQLSAISKKLNADR
ncbi:MAG: diacylglycerol kinase family protein [candidate division NC10 bacterium]|nr:diacylglycerol kinase family protein [candidate division NC10 bacterium]MDE2484455.1 diacylglycerol kinase family protein [candidate division NC10 bacterium]